MIKKLLPIGAIAAITFNATAAVTLHLDTPYTSTDPAYSMSLTFEETTRANEVKVTFTANNIGSNYVDGFVFNLPEGLNYATIQLGGVTQEAGFFQAPTPAIVRDSYFGPGATAGGNNPGIFDVGVGFVSNPNSPNNVLFTEGDSVSFLVTSTQGATLTVNDIAQQLDTPTGQWVAAASVITSPGYCAWYTANSAIPEPSTSLLALLSLVPIMKRRR